MKILVNTVLLFALVLSSVQLLAQPTNSIEQGDYVIHYSVFNSTFVPADIASIYSLPRSKNKALVNISVHLKSDNQSVPATVKGTAKNLIQQQSELNFQEIKEQDTQYYLASLRHTNEEMMHFKITVTPKGSNTDIPINFSQKLYLE